MSRFIERYWPPNRFGSKWTHSEAEIIESLREYAEAHGTQNANSLYAHVMSDLLRNEWANRESVVQVEGGHKTALEFLGKKCTCRASPLECVDFPSLDHRSFWRRKNGSLLLVAQPYGLNSHTIIQWAERNNLSVSISAWSSFYFPGHSLMIEIERFSGVKGSDS